MSIVKAPRIRDKDGGRCRNPCGDNNITFKPLRKRRSLVIYPFNSPYPRSPYPSVHNRFQNSSDYHLGCRDGNLGGKDLSDDVIGGKKWSHYNRRIPHRRRGRRRRRCRVRFIPYIIRCADRNSQRCSSTAWRAAHFVSAMAVWEVTMYTLLPHRKKAGQRSHYARWGWYMYRKASGVPVWD